MANISRLRLFVTSAALVTERHAGDERRIIAELAPRLADLVAHDDWLPEDYALADPAFYRQYLLHADPLDRLSIVSFVWGPGQKTPVHDHLTWGLVGVLRGAEISTGYTRAADGTLVPGPSERLEAGRVVAVSPELGDIHAIANAHDDRESISIHIYGRNIGCINRWIYNPENGTSKEFVSGYSNGTIPNLWGAA